MKDFEDVDGICSCGRILYIKYDDSGKRIGTTHTPEDDEYHHTYWGKATLKFK